MGKLFFSLRVSPLFVLTLLSWTLAASSPFHRSPIWDAIFSWTLNPLSGAVSKICWLTTQHTEDMTTQKFLPFLFGLVLLPDYYYSPVAHTAVSWFCVLTPGPASSSSVPFPLLSVLPGCCGHLLWAATSTHSLWRQHFAFYCNICSKSGRKCFMQLSTSLRVASAAERPPCAWALARLNDDK